MPLPDHPPASAALRVEQLRLDLSGREPPPAPAMSEPAVSPLARRDQRFWPAGGNAAGSPAAVDDPVDAMSQVPRHD